MSEPLDYYVIAFRPDWLYNSTPVYGPFTHADAVGYMTHWDPIPGWVMKVVRVVA